MILAKFAEAISNKNMGLLESLLHDEFLFVEETTLETKEEWLKETRKLLDDGRIDPSKHDITAKTNAVIKSINCRIEYHIIAKHNCNELCNFRFAIMWYIFEIGFGIGVEVGMT